MGFHLDGETVAPANVVLLLHGLGTNGENMRPMARALATRLPQTVFVSPDAPWTLLDAMPREDARMARIMNANRDWSAARSWFAQLSPDERERGANRAVSGMTKADALQSFQDSLTPLLDALGRLVDSVQAQYGLGADALAVYGFSVGGAVATYFGMRREPQCAGVVCHSAAVPGARTVHSRPPMLLMAGSKELGFFKPLRKSFPVSAIALRALSVPVEEHVCNGLGHDVNLEAIERAAVFLRRVLNVSYQ